MTLPVLFSWSGGKDSAMALLALLRCNPEFEVAAILTTVTEGYERISTASATNFFIGKRSPSACPWRKYAFRHHAPTTSMRPA